MVWNKGISLTEWECKGCGKIMVTPKWLEKKYCSLECYHQHRDPWNKGKTKEEFPQLSNSGSKKGHHHGYKKGFDPNRCYDKAKQFQNNPNLPSIHEKKLISLFRKAKLPYKYIGNGLFFIEKYNPDFINCNGQKKLIELAWHGKEKMDRAKVNSIIYKKYGFDTLILTEKNFKNSEDLINKIRCFDGS